MNVYEYSPPKSNKKASGIILILFSLAAGLFLFTILFPNIPFKWAIQLISIVAFVAVIFIISRYVAKSFVYAITEADDGTLDPTVTEITNAGRTQITVCRIALSNIEEAYLLDRSNPEHIEKIKSLQKSAKADGRKSFNYCPDINPTELCIILVEECGEKFLIKISPDATLWKYLKNK
jgi:hypothetical protein